MQRNTTGPLTPWGSSGLCTLEIVRTYAAAEYHVSVFMARSNLESVPYATEETEDMVEN